MKKILALTLAAVMAAGMSTVAFAETEPSIETGSEGKFWAVDTNDDGTFRIGGDKNELGITDVVGGEKKVAIFLYEKGSDTYVTDEDVVDRWKATADWNIGDVDEKPIIERVRVEHYNTDTKEYGDREYVYAVTFVLPEAPETKEADLAGTVTIYRTNKDKDKDYNQFDVELTYGFTPAYELTDGEDLDKDVTLVSFEDYDDVAYITFGDDFEFEVDVTGQGKLNLKNDRKFDPEFAAYYDYANIDFINFIYEPAFNKTGTAFIYAPEDAFIYKKGAEGAEKINGLEWNEDYEAWTFRTRKLESYIISDVELDEKTVTEDKDDTTTDDGKTNPDTGR